MPGSTSIAKLDFEAPVRHLGSVESTMSLATAWATEGAEHGATIVAEHQTAGRGRHGRTWVDETGSSLLLSVVLRPQLGADRLALVGIAAGLALIDMLHGLGVSATLKWPNDVQVGGRKVAGLLAEAAWTGAAPVVILGAGVNVLPGSVPPGFEDVATCVSDEAGRLVARLEPLRPFLDALSARLADAEHRPDVFLEDAEARILGLSEPVVVSFPGTDRAPIRGVAVGLAADGALRVLTEDGIANVHAGEVSLRVSPAISPPGHVPSH